MEEIRLVEDDVPGAALKGRSPSDLLVSELKRWLAQVVEVHPAEDVGQSL